MVDPDHSSGLTSDIQRALQLAVGEANNAFIQSQSGKGPKKKRARSDGAPEGDEQKGEKKKKKKTSRPVNVDEIADSRPTIALASQDGQEAGKQAASASQTLPHEIEQQQELSVDNHNTSSAAFLNAVVAAASATSGAQSLDLGSYQTHSSYQDHHVLPGQPAPYLQYPVQYGFHDPAQFNETPPLSQTLFSGIGGPVPDFQFMSNDEILRALQDMDVSKIASVLKTLGDAAASGNATMSGPSSFVAPVPHATDAIPQSSSSVTPASNGTALSSAPKSTKSSHKRVLDMSLPGPEKINADHTHMLANKWMNASKLAELVKTQGLVYKKGKFSAIEEQQLKTAIETFKSQRGLSDDQVLEIIFQKNEKAKDNTFWSEITAAVPQRPIIAVYHHVRRTFHPKKQQGKWMPEEDNLLKQAVADLGQQWEKVSEIVGRMSSDCRDRYRNHIANREVRVTGPWSREEEEELTRIVTELTVDQGKDFDNDVFWGIVSDKMNNRRGRQQCRIKWTDSLSKTVKNEGQKPRWSPQDAYILVHKVDSLKVRDDTEIDWKTLPDPDWNLWSAHSLQRRWLTMKRGIKGYEEMTHQEIMDILRVKKAHLPPAPPTRRRKVTSAASVDDQDAVLDPELSGYPQTGSHGSTFHAPASQGETSGSQERDVDGPPDTSSV